MTKPMMLRSRPPTQSQKAPCRPSLLGEQAEQFDGADDQGDGDGQAGDGEVVVDLADRLGERPAVGEVHERAVDGVQQAHARRRTAPAGTGSRTRAGRRRRRCRPAPAGRPRWRCRSRGRTAGRAGTSATGLVIDFMTRPRMPVHEAAVVQLLLERRPRRSGRARICAEHLPDARPGSRRLMTAMTYRNVPETVVPIRPVTWCSRGVVVLDRVGQGLDARARAGRPARRRSLEWPSENQKPTDSGRLPVAHQLAGGVVDRGDVVGVEGVPHAQGVRGHADADAERLGARGCSAAARRSPPA